MGAGDELMVTGQVRQMRATNSRKVRVLDRKGQPRWSDLWSGNPGIARPNERGALQILRNGPGLRPYVDYTRSTPQRWAYADWRAEPGELFGITPDPRGEGRVLIEPNLKGNASPNKQWGHGNWLALLRATGIRWAQMCPPGVHALPGVERIETATFKQAAGVLLAARGAVLPEGGLHHAAAALDKRVVVLFGGMVSPRQTGYSCHENIAIDDPEALGWRIPHRACDRAWSLITPAMVLAALEKTL